MNKTAFKAVGLTVVAILIAGLILKHGSDLPVIEDARDGFGG